MIARVNLWGRLVGVASQSAGTEFAVFQYDPDFAGSGIEVAPLTMPLRRQPFCFPDLPVNSFHRLPGLLADSLPDRFGNLLINAWLQTQGQEANSFSAIERLRFIGKRGMGALEFSPVHGPALGTSSHVEVSELVNLASEVLSARKTVKGLFKGHDAKKQVLHEILRVGTSAGGARAKAVVAWNPKTHEVRSGQIPTGKGFGYWLIKFDGVSGNKDKEAEDAQGFGSVEFAYSLMAKASGIRMSECRMLEENGRRHFMTRRFDRLPGGGKLHMQSLGALAHFDFNQAGAYSYEQALLAMRKIGLATASVEEQFRRMVFNIVARNQDDHVKNIAFLMDKKGVWSLSPAFDVCYSYNPDGAWTSLHQMSVNGKRRGFSLEDLKACAKAASLSRNCAANTLEEVSAAVKKWPAFAAEAGVSEEWAREIARAHRLEIPRH